MYDGWMLILNFKNEDYSNLESILSGVCIIFCMNENNF